MVHQGDKTEKIQQLRFDLAQIASKPGAKFFDRDSEEAKARVRKRALLLLEQRARSRAELKARLFALDFDATVVEDVIEDLERVHLVDDEQFAFEWVRQRQQRRGKSVAALDYELREKGVSANIRASALAQVNSQDEKATAQAVAVKKARAEKAIPQSRSDYDKALRRIVGALARRGFNQTLAIETSRAALAERIAELEHRAL